ncbi:hypothetical protein ACJX0J_014967, partial [Zea mays]
TEESALVITGIKGRINRAVWGPLNRTIITAGEDATIRIWDSETGQLLKESDKESGHQKTISSLSKSLDWSHFITGSLDKSAKLWDTRTLTLIKTYVTERPVNAVDISPTHDTVVLGGGQDAMNVTMTDRRAGKFEAKFYHKILQEEIGGVKGHFGPINALAFNPDGRSHANILDLYIDKLLSLFIFTLYPFYTYILYVAQANIYKVCFFLIIGGEDGYHQDFLGSGAVLFRFVFSTRRMWLHFITDGDPDTARAFQPICFLGDFSIYCCYIVVIYYTTKDNNMIGCFKMGSVAFAFTGLEFYLTYWEWNANISYLVHKDIDEMKLRAVLPYFPLVMLLAFMNFLINMFSNFHRARKIPEDLNMVSKYDCRRASSYKIKYITLREAIRQEYREVVERRVFTVTGNRPDEETIDDLIETGKSEQIFKDAIQHQGRGQILDTVAEIQERHDAVRDLERKLLELQQIFMDMAVLVEAQGDMINNIETHQA